MAVHDTVENGRSILTQMCLECVRTTVEWSDGHRMIIVDNGSCDETKKTLERHRHWMTKYHGDRACEIITLKENIGTARAINKAWVKREPFENAVKMDNDVHTDYWGWLEVLEECVARDPTLGIVGLKRKDCIENTWHEDPWYRSELVMLPHELGQRWLIVEKVNHVMGTCQLYSHECLEKIGYLYQIGGLYGFDDALASIRAQVAGFWTGHYSHIEIDHMDVPDIQSDEYTKWKQHYSAIRMDKFNNYKMAYMSGRISYYHGPEDE
jgi:GT2 family glycosyltransferase